MIPLGGCVVTASEDLGMPFAITVGLDGFTVRALPSLHLAFSSVFCKVILKKLEEPLYRIV